MNNINTQNRNVTFSRILHRRLGANKEPQMTFQGSPLYSKHNTISIHVLTAYCWVDDSTVRTCDFHSMEIWFELRLGLAVTLSSFKQMLRKYPPTATN